MPDAKDCVLPASVEMKCTEKANLETESRPVAACKWKDCRRHEGSFGAMELFKNWFVAIVTQLCKCTKFHVILKMICRSHLSKAVFKEVSKTDRASYQFLIPHVHVSRLSGALK